MGPQPEYVVPENPSAFLLTTTTLYSVTQPVLLAGASYWIVTEPTSMVVSNFTYVDYRWFDNTSGTTVSVLQEKESTLPTDPWGNPATQQNLAFRVDGPACFLDVRAGLTGVTGLGDGGHAVAWGDYDNEGDHDILLTGSDGTTQTTRVYRRSGGSNPTFTDIGAGLAGASDAAVAWGDYDRDADLDILIAGSAFAKVYRNSGGTLLGLQHL